MLQPAAAEDNISHAVILDFTPATTAVEDDYDEEIQENAESAALINQDGARNIELAKIKSPLKDINRTVKEKQLVAFIRARLQKWRDGTEPYLPELDVNNTVLKNNRHKLSISKDLKRPVTLFWLSTTIGLLYIWLKLTVVFWPRNPEEPLYGHFVMFFAHIVFMDLVPNFATGYMLHKLNCLKNNCHKKEHQLTKSGELWTIFFVTTVYGFYALLYMCAWGLVIACPQGNGCFQWYSAMWLSSFSYTCIGLLLRISFYTARRKPILYTNRVFLNMARFYWAHFHFNEWENYCLFGAQTPFWDVIFGTCPYNIPYSTPIPFVDFFITDTKVFRRAKHPRAYRWNLTQKVWHYGWTITLFVLFAVVLPLAML